MNKAVDNSPDTLKMIDNIVHIINNIVTSPLLID